MNTETKENLGEEIEGRAAEPIISAVVFAAVVFAAVVFVEVLS